MPLLQDYPQLLAVQSLARKEKVPVHLVGGFCRDQLLGRPCLDFDFAVAQDAILFARKFSRRIRGAFVLLDEENGCARVVKRRPDGKNETYDFADFRGKGIRQDVRQRDFTINTLSCPVNDLRPADGLKDVLQDFCQGQKDLKARRIRMAASRAFCQDPLRLLRAFSLQAQLNFRIDPATLRQIKRDLRLIRTTSPERIRDEMFKILETPAAGRNIIALDKIGLLEQIIPQISVMYRVKQGGYHHLKVWPHSLETLIQLERIVQDLADDAELAAYLREPISGGRSRLALMKLAAILHDIGKPETYKKEGEKISFHGHERVGAAIVKQIAVDLKLSTQERFALQGIVLWHLRPGYLSNFQSPSRRAVFRYFRDTRAEAAAIATLSLADQAATRGPMTTKKDQAHHEKICRRLIKEYFAEQKAQPFVRLINGDDLIRELKLKPSPVFARILTEVEELQADGTLKDKAAALALAKKIAEREEGKSRSPANEDSRS